MDRMVRRADYQGKTGRQSYWILGVSVARLAAPCCEPFWEFKAVTWGGEGPWTYSKERGEGEPYPGRRILILFQAVDVDATKGGKGFFAWELKGDGQLPYVGRGDFNRP